MPEQDLKLKAQVEGAEKASADLDKIDAAQTRVTDQQKHATTTTQGMTDAQLNLNAAEGDFVGILSNLDPRLGRYADLLLKGLKVTNEFSQSSISLTGILSKLNAGLSANIGLLKLLAAGTGAVAALYALYTAYKQLAIDAEAAHEAMAGEAEATEKSRVAHDELADAILREANARERIDPIGRPLSRELAGQVERLGEKLGLSEGQLGTVTSVYEAYAGAVSPEKMRSLAMMQLGGADVMPGAGVMGDEALQHSANVALRDRDKRDKGSGFIGDIEADMRASAQGLQEQAARGGGAEIEALIAEMYPDIGDDRKAKILQALEITGATPGGAEGGKRAWDVREQISKAADWFTGAESPELIGPQVDEHTWGGKGAVRLQPEGVRQFDAILAAIEAQGNQTRVGFQIVNAADAITQQGRATDASSIANDREGQ